MVCSQFSVNFTERRHERMAPPGTKGCSESVCRELHSPRGRSTLQVYGFRDTPTKVVLQELGMG